MNCMLRYHFYLCSFHITSKISIRVFVYWSLPFYSSLLLLHHVPGEIDWVFFMDINGNRNRLLKVNHTGDLQWRFKKGRKFNETHTIFNFQRPKSVLIKNDTVNYWMFVYAKNHCLYMVNPKMFTILGNGNLTDEFRPLTTIPADEYYHSLYIRKKFRQLNS